jgi:hypothetical protein
MTLAEKTKKLLDYSVILKANEKKNWLELLPGMTDKQVQTLYNVLVDEVNAWRKEGIKIIQDKSMESELLPSQAHGASLNSLKAILEVAKPEVLNPEQKQPVSAEAFKKELQREVQTPELNSSQDLPPGLDMPPHVKTEHKPETPTHKPPPVPVLRNKIPRTGLKDLKHIKDVEDLSKIEPAHLRQGALDEQLALIKNRIISLANDNDLLPVNIIPLFEKSPLFQVYLRAGSLLIERNVDSHKMALDEIRQELESLVKDSLSQEEFEAIVDFKKDLEAMAGM